MGKLAFFLKFYRNQKMRFLVLVFIFAFAGAILSCTFLIQNSNEDYFQVQMQKIAEEYQRPENFVEEGRFAILDTMEKVLTVFSLCSILIVIWGCTSILFFQNISMEKSHAMLRIFGMQKKDVFFRALAEGISFGVLGGIIGDAGGFFLFRHLSKKLCSTQVALNLFSLEMLKVLLVVILLLAVISFFGSFISGLYIYEKPIAVMLYGRKAEKEKETYRSFVTLEIVLLYLLAVALFFENRSFIHIILLVCFVVLSLLSGVFYLMFHRKMKHRNAGGKNLDKISHISYRFLCTRSRRDAVLAATISVGAVIICFVMNVMFNFSGILRDSYRDNLGYSTLVEVRGLDEGRTIQSILENNGCLYTMGYFKCMNYLELKDISADDYFWAFILERQTDGNRHFQIPEGCFAAENRFASVCSLKLGTDSGIFGRDLTYWENIQERQWLSLMPYNIKINRQDFNLELDDTWNTVFLLDLSRREEKNLISLLEDEECTVGTASQLADALIELMSDYLSVVVAAGAMLILVTGVFFYSMVRSDLLERKKELYLYQVYGASRKKAFWVVYLEYLMIAWLASFSVVFVTMVLGEAVFFLMLNKHYPLSVPVVLITSLISTLFVLGCCMLAQWISFKSTKMEIIRDE